MSLTTAIWLESYLESFKVVSSSLTLRSVDSQNLIQKVSKYFRDESQRWKGFVRILFRKFQSMIRFHNKHNADMLESYLESFKVLLYTHIFYFLLLLESYLESFKVSQFTSIPQPGISQNLIQKVSKSFPFPFLNSLPSVRILFRKFQSSESAWALLHPQNPCRQNLIQKVSKSVQDLDGVSPEPSQNLIQKVSK